jgi:hypothetical protein
VVVLTWKDLVAMSQDRTGPVGNRLEGDRIVTRVLIENGLRQAADTLACTREAVMETGDLRQASRLESIELFLRGEMDGGELAGNLEYLATGGTQKFGPKNSAGAGGAT